MKVKSYSSWVLPALLMAFVVGACADDEWQVTETPTFAKECPPGQAAKGKCDVDPPPPPPPDGPVEPDLPDAAPRDGLVKPNRMAVTPDGNLLVADPHTIQYVPIGSLQPTSSLDTQGRPAGIALLANKIFVGNGDTGGIDMYAAEGGAFLGSIGYAGMQAPSDLEADEESGLLFVSDVRAGQVFVFDTDGVFIRAISSKGVSPDQLFAPMGLALDPVAGEVFVSDWGDFGNANAAVAYVKIFGYDGTYVDRISGEGDCGMVGCFDGFSRPGDLAVKGTRVFIPDVLLAQVVVFDRNTKTQVAAFGGRPELRLPTAAEIVNDTDLYVASTKNGEVVLYTGGAQ
jgi:DNA-binding beta-propeller fold protein YncE